MVEGIPVVPLVGCLGYRISELRVTRVWSSVGAAESALIALCTGQCISLRWLWCKNIMDDDLCNSITFVDSEWRGGCVFHNDFGRTSIV